MPSFSRIRLFVPGVLLAASAAATAQTGVAPVQTPGAQLGGSLFFDTSLSRPPGQSCAACHAPGVGFTGPLEAINQGGGVYPGAVHGRFRQPQAADLLLRREPRARDED